MYQNTSLQAPLQDLRSLPHNVPQHVIGTSLPYDYVEVEVDRQHYIFKNMPLSGRPDMIMVNSRFRQIFMGKELTITEYDMLNATPIPVVHCSIFMIQPMMSKDSTHIDEKKILHSVKKSMINTAMGNKHYVTMMVGDSIAVITMTTESEEGYITKKTEFTTDTLTRKPSLRDIVAKFKAEGIMGLDKQLHEISSIIATRSMDKSIMSRYGLNKDMEKGIILYGPPGTGKTTIAKALAYMFGPSSKCHVISASKVLDKYIGESEKAVAAPFNEARQDYKRLGDAAPVHIIIIDEIEALFPKRSSSDSVGGQVNNRIVGEVLQALNGVDDFPNILVIGTTNHLEMLDEAMIREGRIGTKIHVPLPDESARREILQYYLKDSNIREGINVEKIAAHTSGYSPAALRSLVKTTVKNEVLMYGHDATFTTEMFISNIKTHQHA